MKKLIIFLTLTICLGFIDSAHASEEDKDIIIVPYSGNPLSES